MGVLFGAGEMEEEDGEGAGAAEEQGEVDSEDEGSSQGGEDEDEESDPELREWWAKKTSDPDWEKRQEEKMQRMEEQLKWLVREGVFR